MAFLREIAVTAPSGDDRVLFEDARPGDRISSDAEVSPPLPLPGGRLGRFTRAPCGESGDLPASAAAFSALA